VGTQLWEWFPGEDVLEVWGASVFPNGGDVGFVLRLPSLTCAIADSTVVGEPEGGRVPHLARSKAIVSAILRCRDTHPSHIWKHR